MQKLKEVVDVLCQPKVIAIIGITAMIVAGFLHNADLAVAGIVIVFCTAAWAAW